MQWTPTGGGHSWDDNRAWGTLTVSRDAASDSYKATPSVKGEESCGITVSIGYSWNGFGEDFFGWFCGIDWGYLLERINPGDVFDRAGSVRRARELVGALRREGVIDKTTRKSALDDLRDKGAPWTGPDDVLAWFRKERPDDSGAPVALSGLVEYRDVPACSRPNPNAEAYCRKGLPALQRALRLAREEGRL